MFDYDQMNKAHQYDLWTHSLHTVVGIPRNMDDEMIYLAALLHDDRVSIKLKHVRRHVKMVSFEQFQYLMVLQIADAKAHVQLLIIAERVEICTALAGKEGQDFYQRILEGE